MFKDPQEQKFQGGRGCKVKNLPWGGGMDIFWNCTIELCVVQFWSEIILVISH